MVFLEWFCNQLHLCCFGWNLTKWRFFVPLFKIFTLKLILPLPSEGKIGKIIWAVKITRFSLYESRKSFNFCKQLNVPIQSFSFKQSYLANLLHMQSLSNSICFMRKNFTNIISKLKKHKFFLSRMYTQIRTSFR